MSARGELTIDSRLYCDDVTKKDVDKKLKMALDQFSFDSLPQVFTMLLLLVTLMNLSQYRFYLSSL